MQAQSQFVLICFKIKFYEDWVSKLNDKIELFVLSTRAAEHMGISNLTVKWVKNMKESAVSDHCLQCDCVISFVDFDVLVSDTNNFRLLIKESLLIKRDKPILNRTIKSFPLKLFD